MFFFRDAPVSQQAAYLDTIRQSTGGGQVYMSALQQNRCQRSICCRCRDTDGQAWWYFGRKKTGLIRMFPCLLKPLRRQFLLARRLVKGTDDAKGIPMPKDADLRLEFSDMVKDAFAGDAQGASMAYEIAKDYYAGVMAKKRRDIR